MDNVSVINGYKIKDSEARNSIDNINTEIEGINNLISNLPSNSGNSNIKIVAGVVRYQNGEWNLLNDEAHKPLNIESIESDNTQQFKINYNFTAKKVLSLVCSPDETYANAGYICGGSVGLDKTIVNISQNRELHAIVSGTSGDCIVSSTYADLPVTGEVISHASLGKYIKLTHSGVGAPPILLSMDKYEWKVLGFTGGYVNIQAYLNGNKVGVPSDSYSLQYTRGPIRTGASSHPDASNIWILGVFEVDE